MRVYLGGGGGALEGAELTMSDLRNGLSATMKSGGAKGADTFGGSKMVGKFLTEYSAHDDFSGPPRRTDSKNALSTCSKLWGPVPLSLNTSVRG